MVTNRLQDADSASLKSKPSAESMITYLRLNLCLQFISACYDCYTDELLGRNFLRRFRIIPLALTYYALVGFSLCIYIFTAEDLNVHGILGCLIVSIILYVVIIGEAIHYIYDMELYNFTRKAYAANADDLDHYKHLAIIAMLGFLLALAFATLRLGASWNSDAIYFHSINVCTLLDVSWLLYMASGLFLGDKDLHFIGIILNCVDLYHAAAPLTSAAGDDFKAIQAFFFIATIYYDPLFLYGFTGLINWIVTLVTKLHSSDIPRVDFKKNYLWVFDQTLLIFTVVIRCTVFRNEFSNLLTTNAVFVVISIIQILLISFLNVDNPVSELPNMERNGVTEIMQLVQDCKLDPDNCQLDFLEFASFVNILRVKSKHPDENGIWKEINNNITMALLFETFNNKFNGQILDFLRLTADETANEEKKECDTISP